MSNDKISIEISPEEAEILCGAIAHASPADKRHEIILIGLYARIKGKMEEFLRR